MIKVKYKLLLGLASSFIFIGCGSSGEYVNGSISETNNTSDNMPQADTTTSQCSPELKNILNNSQYKTTIASYDVKGSSDDDKGSSDDDKGSSGDASHNQGSSCAQCHSGDFDSGATVFTTLDATNGTIGAAGYKIQLGDSLVYNLGRGDGNSNLKNFNGGNYTAHVIDINGNIVNSSAPNSHDSSRLDCNRCHTAGGAAGAPGRIVNYKVNGTTSTTPVPANTNESICVSFSSNVMPILVAKCQSCHGSNGSFSVSSANDTYVNISKLKTTMNAASQYLIDKGANTIGHGGGATIPTSSTEYTTIKAWINEGALNN